MGCQKFIYKPELHIYSSKKMKRRNGMYIYKYRYAFNGKEIDTEGMGGGGSTYDYGFRIYNPNLARFLSLDPLFTSYPWYTPYQFAGNKPILSIDLDGLEEKVATGDNCFTIKAVYVATEQVVANVNLAELETYLNQTYNSNPTLNDQFSFEDDGLDPVSMSQDKAQIIPAKISFDIVVVPELPSDVKPNGNKSRIWTANGKSLGGTIKMGAVNDDAFILKDKEGKPTGSIAAAYHIGNSIVLNPVFYDKSYSGYTGFNTSSGETANGAIAHEIGHDLGLDHPGTTDAASYPKKGLMSNTGDHTPTKEEMETISDPQNKKIIQPGEKYIKDEDTK